jgi:antirestriction protein ArdC
MAEHRGLPGWPKKKLVRIAVPTKHSPWVCHQETQGVFAMPSQNQIRERITNTIIESLKSGQLAPWRRPWASDKNAGFPTNVSGRRYRGINPLLLQIASMRHGFRSKWWATFRQWDMLGGKVMKRPDHVPAGEWGTTVILWKPVTKSEENEQGEEERKSFLIMKTFVVFNIEQVQGDHLDRIRVGHDITNTNPIETYEEADRVIEATKADIRYGGNAAFYNRAHDYIQVPLREQFTAAEYYETVFHELCHWSEAPNRLNWNRADEGYAMGELIAEMGSCFLASELGIPNAETLPNHASYLEHWLKAMAGDHRFIFQASSQASKAADFVLSFSRAVAPADETAVAA